MSEIDWASLKKDAEDATRPIPAGKYNVFVEKAEARLATTGANMVSATIRISDGPHKNRVVWNNFVLTPDKPFALAMFFRSLGAFGITDEFFAAGPSMEQVAAVLVERHAIADITISTYQGQERNQCSGFSAPTDLSLNPPISGDLSMVAIGSSGGGSFGAPGGPGGGPTLAPGAGSDFSLPSDLSF